jgi:hypothetical protein
MHSHVMRNKRKYVLRRAIKIIICQVHVNVSTDVSVNANVCLKYKHFTAIICTNFAHKCHRRLLQLSVTDINWTMAQRYANIMFPDNQIRRGRLRKRGHLLLTKSTFLLFVTWVDKPTHVYFRMQIKFVIIYYLIGIQFIVCNALDFCRYDERDTFAQSEIQVTYTEDFLTSSENESNFI